MLHDEGVDNEGLDVPDRPGSNEWRRLVVGRLNGEKGTFKEGLDSEELGRIELIHLHFLAASKNRKKVGEQDVEEFKLLCLGNDRNFDGHGAIHQLHIL